MIAHRLLFRFPLQETGDTVLNGRFERVEGGWISLASSTWYPDGALMSASVVRADELQCKHCDFRAETTQGLSAHQRNKHRGLGS